MIGGGGQSVTCSIIHYLLMVLEVPDVSSGVNIFPISANAKEKI
mgnify:CR=1 FL=1